LPIQCISKYEHVTSKRISLRFKKVIEFGLRIQILLEPEDPLSVDDISDLAIRVEQVSEFPDPRRAGLHTSRISSLPYPLDAKGALVRCGQQSGSVSKVVHGRVDLVHGNVRLGPVEDSSFVGARSDTIPAANAPIVIHYHDPIGFLPGGMDRTNFYTGRVLTLLALDGQVGEARFRNQIGIIVMFRIFKIDQVSSFEPEDPDPLELAFISGVIVFLHAGIDASPAADAAGKLKAIPPKSAGQGFLRADLEFSPVSSLVLPFQSGNGAFLILFRHLLKVLLQKFFSLFLGTGGEKGNGNARQRSERKITNKLSPCIISLLHPSFHGPAGWWLRFYGFESWLMGIMAMGTEEIGSLAGPHEVSGPLPMDTCFPVLIDISVAFTAEPVAFGEIDQLSIIEAQFIPVFCVVTIEAPSHRLRMAQLDIRMFFFQLPLLSIDFHGSVTIAAGENAFRHGQRRNRELFSSLRHKREKEGSQDKERY
jgi:hypothetical protein